MYKVLCDNALMCDSRIEELALINPVVKLEENKAGSFSFKIPPAHPYYNTIQKRKTIVEVYQDDDLIFSGMCIEATTDFYKRKDIYCEGELTYFNDSVQRPARYQGATVRGLLEAYIANHNAQVEESKRFEVGQVTVTDPNNYISCYTNMESTMKAIKEDLVDDLGGIIRIRHENGVKYVDYLAESPNTNSQVIKLGKNLTDFKSNIDSTDIATAIIPLGAKLENSAVEGLETRLTIESVNEGLDYVHSAEAVNEYGWIYKTVTYDNVTAPEALKRKGEQYLSETQFENVVIEAKAIDLHFTDKSIERFKLSDQIRVKSAPHGLNKYFRLTKQTLNLNSPEKDKITLGKTEKQTLSAKTNQASEEVRKAVESIVPPNHILQQAVSNATALITSAMGGYVVKTNEELLIMDTDNIETATKVWRWNINGLGYSSNGYKGPYSLAMTMDGRIVADFIYGAVTEAKTVKVENLTGDTIEGFNIKGCNITSASDLFEALLYFGAFTVSREGEERAFVGASAADDNNTGFIRLKSSNGNEVIITADGININNEGSGGSYGYIKSKGPVTAKNITANENITAKNIYAQENAQITGTVYSQNAIVSGLAQGQNVIATEGIQGKNAIVENDIQAGNNITATNELRGESLAVNQMGIGGGAIQYVEWVYNEQMDRWCLCTIT